MVLAGNHDSVATLNESRDIMAFLNTTVVASAGHAPQILPRRDGTPGAVLCPIPFYVRVTLLPAAGLNGIENSSIYWQRLPIITNNTMPMPANCAAISLCPSSPRDI